MMDAQWWAEIGQWEEYFDSIREWVEDYNREEFRLLNLTEEVMGYKVHEMKDSKFLKKEDVGAGVLVTIKGIDRENVAKEGADAEYKFVMYFDELEKPLVLNQTNIQACQMACGGSEDTSDWAGQKIVLFNDPNVSYAGKIMGGIRLRKPKQAVQQAIAASKEILAKQKLPVEAVNKQLNDQYVDEEDLPF